MKTCPYCAEAIQDAAVVCKHCGREIPPATPPPAEPVAQKAANPAAVGCLLVTFLFLGFCAYVAVKAPSTSADPDLPAKVAFSGTQFVITNTGGARWTDTKADVNGGLVSGGFSVQIGTVEPGAVVTVGAMQFAKADGTRFNPFEMKPQKFVLTATMNGKLAVYVGGWP